eukprot:SAG11_NODE_12425_length_704_cov_0.847934_1_plen_122_part_10
MNIGFSGDMLIPNSNVAKRPPAHRLLHMLIVASGATVQFGLFARLYNHLVLAGDEMELRSAVSTTSDTTPVSTEVAMQMISIGLVVMTLALATAAANGYLAAKVEKFRAKPLHFLSGMITEM